MASVQVSTSFTIPPMDCANCKRQGAKLVCATCGTFYCSVPCQVKQWPTHRDLCMPRLVMACPLLGTAGFVEQNEQPSMPKAANMMPKTCNDKPIQSNAISNGQNGKQPHLQRQNSNTINTKQIPTNGRKGSVPKVANNEATKENVPSKPNTAQQKIKTIVNKANATNARMSPPVQKPMERKMQEMSLSSDSKTNVEKQTQKAVGHAMEKKMQEMPSVASPKANMEQQVQKIVDANAERQMPKPVAPVANTNTQSNIRSAARKANDQKPDTTIVSQHLQQAPFPEPGTKVQISYVADDKIYIYEAGQGPNGEACSFELLIARSIECSRTVKSFISTPPTVGDIVFAPFDGDHFRAVIKSTSSAMVEVFFPDFGNSQTVQWNTLKEIPDPKIKYANCLTHPVWIQNVPSFTMAMKQFLNQNVDVSEFMLHTVIDVQDTGIKMVELYQCSEQYYLSVKLRNFNLQAMPSPTTNVPPLQPKSPQNNSKYVITNPNTYKPVYIEELIDADVIEGKGIELMIISASESQLSVVPKSNFPLYIAMVKDSDVYGKIDPNPYVPMENEICLVKRDGIWYRAVTLQTADNEFNFYLLDDLQCIAPDDVEIRRYPPGLTRQQFVVECVVENTNVLLAAMGGSYANADTLSGRSMKADVHQSQADEDTYETTHLTIVSISK